VVSDWVSIFTIFLVLAGVSLLGAGIINRIRRPADKVQPVLERDPILGKDFREQFYPDLPPFMVFEVRSEFARLAGVPSDFVLPDDRLVTFGAQASAEIMRSFVVELMSASGNAVPDAAPGEGGQTLDGYIRYAEAIWRGAHASQHVTHIEATQD
jgi:hypothetical protein